MCIIFTHILRKNILIKNYRRITMPANQKSNFEQSVENNSILPEGEENNDPPISKITPFQIALIFGVILGFAIGMILYIIWMR
jgi:hypothetical protein